VEARKRRDRSRGNNHVLKKQEAFKTTGRSGKVEEVILSDDWARDSLGLGKKRGAFSPYRTTVALSREGCSLFLIGKAFELEVKLSSETARDLTNQIFRAYAPPQEAQDQNFRVISAEHGPSNPMTFDNAMRVLEPLQDGSRAKFFKVVREITPEGDGRAVLEEIPWLGRWAVT
jgi:hypothetical protein